MKLDTYEIWFCSHLSTHIHVFVINFASLRWVTFAENMECGRASGSVSYRQMSIFSLHSISLRFQIEWFRIMNMKYCICSVTQSQSLYERVFCFAFISIWGCVTMWVMEQGGGQAQSIGIYNSLFVNHYIVWSSIVISYYYIILTYEWKFSITSKYPLNPHLLWPGLLWTKRKP